MEHFKDLNFLLCFLRKFMLSNLELLSMKDCDSDVELFCDINSSRF